MPKFALSSGKRKPDRREGPKHNQLTHEDRARERKTLNPVACNLISLSLQFLLSTDIDSTLFPRESLAVGPDLINPTPTTNPPLVCFVLLCSTLLFSQTKKNIIIASYLLLLVHTTILITRVPARCSPLRVYPNI